MWEGLGALTTIIITTLLARWNLLSTKVMQFIVSDFKNVDVIINEVELEFLQHVVHMKMLSKLFYFEFLHNKEHRKMPLNPYYTPHIMILLLLHNIILPSKNLCGPRNIQGDDSCTVQWEHHINSGQAFLFSFENRAHKA